MNNIQKILLMVFSMSITIFIVTAFIYGSKPALGGEFSIWQYGLGMSLLRTNWLGIIALGNSVASILGVFLFSEKQYLNTLVKWIANVSTINKVFVLTLFLFLMMILFAASAQGLI